MFDRNHGFFGMLIDGTYLYKVTIYSDMRVSIVMGLLKQMAGFMDNPIYRWMITGGTPVLGNPHKNADLQSHSVTAMLIDGSGFTNQR